MQPGRPNRLHFRCVWLHHMDILFNLITCGTRSSPSPAVAPAPRGEHSQPSATLLPGSSSEPPCNAVGLQLVAVHTKFSFFPQVAQTFRERATVLNANTPRRGPASPC